MTFCDPSCLWKLSRCAWCAATGTVGVLKPEPLWLEQSERSSRVIFVGAKRSSRFALSCWIKMIWVMSRFTYTADYMVFSQPRLRCHFLPRDAIHSANYAVAWCPSVTGRFCVKTAKRIFKHYHRRVANHSSFLYQMSGQYSHGDHQRGRRIQESMKNSAFRRIFRFILEIIQDRATVTIKCE